MLSETSVRISHIDSLNLDVETSLNMLRELTLDEFGELLLSLPTERFRHLSTILPNSTPDHIQQEWTGSSGEVLLRQSVSFINFVVTNYVSVCKKDVRAAKVMDFGCGWGRLLRLMTFFANPSQLYGCDPWDASLKHAIDAGVLGTLAKSDVRPEDLPFSKTNFDLIYSFSVFTHLPIDVSKICLAAIHKSMSPNGLLVITIRPREYWKFASENHKTSYARQESEHDQKGYSFLPNPQNPDYGAATVSLNFLKQNFVNWKVVRAGTTLSDVMQMFVCLQPIKP